MRKSSRLSSIVSPAVEGALEEDIVGVVQGLVLCGQVVGGDSDRSDKVRQLDPSFRSARAPSPLNDILDTNPAIPFSDRAISLTSVTPITHSGRRQSMRSRTLETYSKPQATMADHPGVPVCFEDGGYRSVRTHVQERAERDLYRVDRIVNRLFLEFSDTTNRLSVMSEVADESGSSLWIGVRNIEGHPGKVSVLENQSISLKARHAYLSHNKCVLVLKAFAPTVAFFTEGLCPPLHPARPKLRLTSSGLTPSIEVHEAHIDHVEPDQEVEVTYWQEEYSETAMLTLPVAAWHSMFRITPTDEHNLCRPEKPARLNGTGTYLDPTAAQYGRDQGLRDAGVYHTLSPESKTLSFTSLGYHYYECQSDEEEDVGRAPVRALETEAYIRTLDNAIHKVVEEVGGRAELFDMSPTNFEATLELMATQARLDLLKVAGELYFLDHIPPPDTEEGSSGDINRYQAVADRCMGAGHRRFLRALRDRVPRSWKCEDDFLDCVDVVEGKDSEGRRS